MNHVRISYTYKLFIKLMLDRIHLFVIHIIIRIKFVEKLFNTACIYFLNQLFFILLFNLVPIQ